jgi:hypothetical protein|tara:strand:- start:126 stop:230 length:105 start_codon:yes stop_codon:yes gene_type:complete
MQEVAEVVRVLMHLLAQLELEVQVVVEVDLLVVQ